MAEFATKGVGNTALGLSIGALGAELLSGGLNGLLGGLGGSSRYEAALAAENAELKTEVKLRDANLYTLGEMDKLRNYFDGRIAKVEHEICDQKVLNATMVANQTCMANQIAALNGLTKLVIPNANVCPGWGDVTVAVTPTTTTTA